VEITTERIEIPLAGGGSMGGYLTRPTAAGPHPGVLVFMEIFGINAHIRDVTERVAREGYVALAPDFFHRTGPGAEYGYDDEGFANGMVLLNGLAADEMLSDVQAALSALRARDDVATDKVGCMGFCIGGHMAYLTACETGVAAAASFYGGGIAAPQGPGGAESTIGRTSKIRGRILCLFGGQDAFIPTEQAQAVEQALADAGVRSECVTYDRADHGFFCDQRGTYDPSAAADAWERVKRMFAEELQGGSPA
jgi:carboxymethylenebutenolidase